MISSAKISRFSPFKTFSQLCYKFWNWCVNTVTTGNKCAIWWITDKLTCVTWWRKRSGGAIFRKSCHQTTRSVLFFLRTLIHGQHRDGYNSYLVVCNEYYSSREHVARWSNDNLQSTVANRHYYESMHCVLTFIQICQHRHSQHHARIQVFLGGWSEPPLRLSAIFFCLLICPGPCNNLDPLLKFLYEPPPPSDVRTPPPFWILDPRLNTVTISTVTVLTKPLRCWLIMTYLPWSGKT